MTESLSPATIARRSIRFYWPVAVSIGLGVAIATAVITGALVVGDSMRSSLRGLTVDRLGRIDQAIIPGGFFGVDGLPEIVDGRRVHPVILFSQAVLELGSGAEIRRAGSVQVIGVEESFWELDPAVDDPPQIGDDQIVLNRAVADDLGVRVGDTVTVRLPAEQAVPADSPLGRRETQTEGIPRLEVLAIIENRGLGRFALEPNQAEPMTAWLRRETIAETLQRAGTANVLLVSAAAEESQTAEDDAWVDRLPLELSDFGLALRHVRDRFVPADADTDADGDDPAAAGEEATTTAATSGGTVFDYYSLTSDRLLLPGPAVSAIRGRLGAEVAVPLLTYLANAIERVDESGEVIASVPYSTITAIDPSEDFPLDFATAAPSQPQDDSLAVGDDPGQPVPIVLNRWAAEALDAEVGDSLRIAYFEPEVDGGQEVERYFEAVLTSIVPITRPARPYRRTRPAEFDQRPTIYNDPDLTPTVPGVTDQDSISDWDLPFRLEREIGSEDDRYWNEYRLTPKAFLPLAAGRRLFGSRFGDTTSLRIDGQRFDDIERLESEILAALLPDRSRLGWGVIPLRRQQLDASRGTTPFDALFLSLSFFVILAALMLIALLFRLGLMQRAREYGVLLATGFPGPAVSRLAILEGSWIAGPGIVLGVLGGLAYAAAVLAGLRSWWVGAVTVPFLQFHASAQSLLLGAIAGALVSWITLFVTARRLRGSPARELLAGRIESGPSSAAAADGETPRYDGWLARLPLLLLIVALAVAAIGFGRSGPAQAGAFVGGGMLLLAATLLAIHRRLARPRRQHHAAATPRRQTLPRLAWTNVGRNPLRSTLSIGLMASASFLIVSISAFQLTPTESGVGGFDLIGRTATPLYRDLNDSAVRAELLGGDAETLSAAEIVSLRLQPGQDASCNNLYQASQPQVYGVPKSIGELTRETPFQWAAATSNDSLAEGSPWDALQGVAAGTAEDPVPLVLDQNTAMWSLQMRGGIGEVRSFSWRDGETIHFRVVGLLANSVLQGSLMIGEENFERHFPQISGYQVFLVRTPAPEAARGVLESRLGDIGMDVNPSRVVLARLMAVQNTYLRTFQSLGALGLLLGTVGLAIAQLRNALERQGELALLRAIGFARRRLAAAVMLENVFVLAAGIGTGVLCAALAVTPYLLAGQTVPPIIGPLVWVLLIALFGVAAGSLAVARVVRLPLVGALRR